MPYLGCLGKTKALVAESPAGDSDNFDSTQMQDKRSYKCTTYNGLLYTFAGIFFSGLPYRASIVSNFKCVLLDCAAVLQDPQNVVDELHESNLIS